jgi:hypothetical protein
MAQAERIGKLRTGVAAKKAYATRIFPDGPLQGFDLRPPWGKMGFLEGPVLAKEAIEIARFKGNGQIAEAHLGTAVVGKTRITRTRASRADPVSHAVRRERIIIGGYQAAGSAIVSHARFAAMPHSAIPFLVLSQSAPLKTQLALDSTGFDHGARGQAKHFPRLCMDFFDPAPALVRAISYAGRANPYTGGNIIEALAAQKAFGPFFASYGFGPY